MHLKTFLSGLLKHSGIIINQSSHIVHRNIKIPNHLGFIRFHPRKMSSKPKVFVTLSVNDIPDKINAVFKESCEVEYYNGADNCPRQHLMEKIRGKNALYCIAKDTIDAELLNTAGADLKVISTMSVGYDHIDVNECKKRNVAVGYTPGVLTDATADLTVTLLLAAMRRLVEATKEVTNGGWSSWRPFWLNGQELTDSTVGIVGLGRIGQAVLNRLKPFGVKRFLYSGNSRKPEDVSLNATFVSFDELLKESDFVVVCCSLNEKTKRMFDSEAFHKMKPNAIFVNTSRGLIVDQEALYEALTTGQIWAAAIDVTDPEPLPPNHKLTTLNNCIILPHIGSSTVKAREKMASITVQNIIAHLNGEKMPERLI